MLDALVSIKIPKYTTLPIIKIIKKLRNILQSKNPSVIALSTASAVSVTGLAFISPVILLLKSSYQISSNEVQLTITIYLMAICVSQMFWGPLSDIIGRRKVLLFGAALFFNGGIFGVFKRIL